MPRIDRLLIALTVIALSFSMAAQSQTPPAYKYFRLGAATNITATSRPGFALMGGGTDLDEAFRWLCGRAGGGDLLVLRATGDDDYNKYIQDLCHLNSVATILIPNRAAALDPFVERSIRQASALFISGGDQANYINFWQGTPVQVALNDAITRGIPIGGTSAGLAVLGEYAYTAQGDRPKDPNLDSKTAMADPFGRRITLAHNFLEIPTLKGLITDSHFATRDRMGRLLTFVAKLKQQQPCGQSSPVVDIHGLGIEQAAAVLLEPDGRATVVGKGSAYFIDARKACGTVAAGKPLNYGPYTIKKVVPGHAFNLTSWTGDATLYKAVVTMGHIEPGNFSY